MGYAAVSTLQAQTNFTEDFESGNLLNWTASAASPLYIATPTNIVPSGGIYGARMTNGACRMFANNLPTGLGITAESFRFTFWYYDNAGTAARAYCEVRNYTGGSYTNGSLGQILAIGKYNNVDLIDGGAYNSLKYQARMAFGSPAGWFNLNAPGSPNRSAGWHKFDIERGVNTTGERIISFYVDDKLGRIWTNSNANAAWDSVILGPGIGTTAGDAWFDGLQVVQGQAYITESPASQTVTLGSGAFFNVSAIGDVDQLFYQWRKNGTNLVGETSASYSIPNVQLSDAGNYTVVVTNSLAVKTSIVAVLTVNQLTHITTQPVSQLVNVGANVQFYSDAVGNGTLAYQWKKNGTNLVGQTETTLNLSSVTTNDAGDYSLFVTNNLGDPSAMSEIATLTVNVAPVLNVSNITIPVNKAAAITVPVTEDIFPRASPFQEFDASGVGDRTMFGHPLFSGTTDIHEDNTGRTYVTNSFPADHGSPQVLHVNWNWTNNSPPAWLRLTTATGGPVFGANPTIYFSNPLRFDIWTSKDLRVAVGLRETGTTAAIGTDAGAGTSIEFAGVSAGGTPPSSTTTVTANSWTTVNLDLPNSGIGSFFSGNGVLDQSTGKGGLEQLALSPADGLAGAYTIYLDNFVSVPTNALAFSLDAGPAGAVIDPVTGVITWTPTSTGAENFTVTVTDYLALSDTKSFTVNVIVPTVPPGAISINLLGSNAVLNWAGVYQLQSHTNLNTTNWANVPGVTSGPYTNPVSGAQKFFRLID